VKNISLELSKLAYVNHLWSDLIENFGFDKAKKLIAQANDLQKMNGINNITMPIIFTGTGGSALISIDLFDKNNIPEGNKGKKIVIFNPKKRIYQILHETK
tara:strand:+ start:213 stop:515 length:303 start_codon:yes stop_codon:yes gene_type:complete